MKSTTSYEVPTHFEKTQWISLKVSLKNIFLFNFILSCKDYLLVIKGVYKLWNELMWRKGRLWSNREREDREKYQSRAATKWKRSVFLFINILYFIQEPKYANKFVFFTYIFIHFFFSNLHKNMYLEKLYSLKKIHFVSG